MQRRVVQLTAPWAAAVGRHVGRVTYRESHGGRACFYSSSKIGLTVWGRQTAYSLKHMEQSAPAYRAGMNDGVGVGQKSVRNVPVPSIPRCVQRHVDQHRCPNNVVARHTAPVPAILRIFPIVAHRPVTIVRNFVRQAAVLRHQLVRSRSFSASQRIVFFQFLPVDPDRSILHVYGLTRQSDHPLHIIRLRRIKWRLENNNLLPVRIAPQRHVPVGERNACVVAHPAHDQVVTDQQRVFHRARGNHPRLPQRPINQHERQNHPEPCNDLALYSRTHGNVSFACHCFSLLVHSDCVRFHGPPSPLHSFCFATPLRALPVEPNRSDNFPYNTKYRNSPLYRPRPASTRSARGIPANPHPNNFESALECLPKRSVLPLSACPPRSNTEKSLADN